MQKILNESPASLGLGSELFHETTLCSEKTPTHASLYISMKNVQIYTKFSGNVQEERGTPLLEKFDILCYW